jgi:hypothetical protein
VFAYSVLNSKTLDKPKEWRRQLPELVLSQINADHRGGDRTERHTDETRGQID